MKASDSRRFRRPRNIPQSPSAFCAAKARQNFLGGVASDLDGLGKTRLGFYCFVPANSALQFSNLLRSAQNTPTLVLQFADKKHLVSKRGKNRTKKVDLYSFGRFLVDSPLFRDDLAGEGKKFVKTSANWIPYKNWQFFL